MKRIIVAFVVFVLLFSVSFSLDFNFTKGISSSTESFKSDNIELLNHKFGSDCRFNFTINGNQILSGENCNDEVSFSTSLDYGKYNAKVITYNISNTSQTDPKSKSIHIVFCKGNPTVSIPNNSSTTPPTIAIWPKITMKNFKCDSSSDNIMIHSSINFTSSNSPIFTEDELLSESGPFSTTLAFNKTSNGKTVNLEFTLCKDLGCTYNTTISKSFKIDDCKNYKVTQPKTCPGDDYYLTLKFKDYCVDSDVKVSVGSKTKALSSNSLTYTLTAPLNPPFVTDISADYSHSTIYHIWKKSYSIAMNPWVGIENAKNISVSGIKFNCRDKNELPVPCDYSYKINLTMHGNIYQYDPNFDYAILMNITYPNGYVDHYAKKVNAKDNFVTFGFDGHTNETCKYTFSHDIQCFTISFLSYAKSVCWSKNIGDIFTSSGSICKSQVQTYYFPCPAPTIQKRWPEVKTVSLPLHFTFGIYNRTENYVGFGFTSEPFSLYRLGKGINVHSTTSSKINITQEAFRYIYHWSITPFNWLVNVLARKDFVPIRLGFNQTPPQTLNGVGKISSLCSGNSTCYTEVPICGDGVCDTASGENCKTCAKDCQCGIWTKGCYGQPNIKGFTDNRGCIIRFKQYEEPCHLSDECDSSKGLVCVHKTLNDQFIGEGHCCKPDEIWDPTTPSGFKDANSSINGTCRVPRGVYITDISIWPVTRSCLNPVNVCDWVSTCHPWQTGISLVVTPVYIADTRITVTVHTDYPYDKVCALFATKPSHTNGGCQSAWFWCSDDLTRDGGATQYCVNANGRNTVTFTFRMNDAGPALLSGYCGRSVYCKNTEPMLFAAYLPYQLNSSISELNSSYYGNETLQDEFLKDLDNYRDNYIAAWTGPSRIETWDPVNDDEGVTFEQFTDWITVNGHVGNILKDKSGGETWAEIVEVYNSGSNSCKNGKAAGNDMEHIKVIFPKGGTTPSFEGNFVCGGNKMKPWNDW